jgi:hypothetical protein
MPEHVLMSEIELITDGGRRRRHGRTACGSGSMAAFSATCRATVGSRDNLAHGILMYVGLCNGRLLQYLLKGRTATEAFKDRHRSKPERCKKRPCNDVDRDDSR